MAGGGTDGACLFLGLVGGGPLVSVMEEEACDRGRGLASVEGWPSTDSSERAGLTLRSPALPDDKLLSPVLLVLFFLENIENIPFLFLSSGCDMAAIVMRSVTERGGAR